MSNTSKNNIGSALQEYEAQIWSTADILRSNGFKASEWPKFMMPFFALMLVESRIIRSKNEKIKEIEIELGCTFNLLNEVHVDLLNEAVLHLNYGYHPELVKFNRPLHVICETQPSNFYTRLMEYLAKYDTDTKNLLGIGYAEGTSKHLDLQGIIGALNAKSHGTVDVLYNFTKAWAKIDLTEFNNSEVTTIEEHIKHKWADISAETAGEHYTPFDVIELCTAINLAIAPIDPEGSWDVYDMTCGGGNFVFGLEDALRKEFPNLSVHSYGQDFNEALYALATIEARFRPSAHIKYGNTLTNDKFTGQQFGSVIGNPPFGLDWKDFFETIKKDKTGRFSMDKLPPITDGQMLFLQHAVSHMKPSGVGSIVHNGSPLTSGDANGGESNIRKYLLKELDVVQAIIQLPQNIFFNTGISTYVWVLNKNKPANLKGKVMLINAENLFTKLKKSLNKKNCAVDEKSRKTIVDTLKAGISNNICKLLSVDELMYNKVELEITRLDENGKSVPEKTKVNKDGKEVAVIEKLSNLIEIHIVNPDKTQSSFTIKDDTIVLTEAGEEETLKQKISEAVSFKIKDGNDIYNYLAEDNIVAKNDIFLGKGVISVKLGKPKKAESHQYKIEISLSPLKEKDSEIVAFSSEEEKNKKSIGEFLSKWVKEPLKILETKVGCEINFNKIFPQKNTVRKSVDILAEINKLDKELGEIK